jgi:hypothetical protein
MRIVQGELIAFPESTLLVDTYPLEYFLAAQDGIRWSSEEEITLDDSYRYYLTYWGASAGGLGENSSNYLASFGCLIHNVDSGMGTIALVLGDYQWVAATAVAATVSKQVGVWLRGKLHFQMEAYVQNDFTSYVRMTFIFNRYRR